MPPDLPLVRHEEVFERTLFDYLLKAFTPEVAKRYYITALTRLPEQDRAESATWVIRMEKRILPKEE